jgi:hypothetical protein
VALAVSPGKNEALCAAQGVGMCGWVLRVQQPSKAAQTHDTQAPTQAPNTSADNTSTTSSLTSIVLSRRQQQPHSFERAKLNWVCTTSLAWYQEMLVQQPRLVLEEQQLDSLPFVTHVHRPMRPRLVICRQQETAFYHKGA